MYWLYLINVRLCGLAWHGSQPCVRHKDVGQGGSVVFFCSALYCHSAALFACYYFNSTNQLPCLLYVP